MQILFNGEACDVPDQLTVAALLQQFGLEPRQVAVEVNLEIAPRDRHEKWILKPDDQVEVVTLVGGG